MIWTAAFTTWGSSWASPLDQRHWGTVGGASLRLGTSPPHKTLGLVPNFFSWLLDFKKICRPLTYPNLVYLTTSTSLLKCMSGQNKDECSIQKTWICTLTEMWTQPSGGAPCEVRRLCELTLNLQVKQTWYKYNSRGLLSLNYPTAAKFHVSEGRDCLRELLYNFYPPGGILQLIGK